MPEPERPLDSAGFAKAAYEAALGREFPTDVFCAPQLRWAVIGCGVIANQMADSLALAGRRIEGVANRHAEKARAFAAAHGVPRVYQTFEELYADPDIDAIYITTPHNTHIGFLRGALAAGKHVLCEKSITLNSEELAEARELRPRPRRGAHGRHDHPAHAALPGASSPLPRRRVRPHEPGPAQLRQLQAL